jgi:hypothetical protein
MNFLPWNLVDPISDVAPAGAEARATLTHGRSEVKPVRKLRRSAAHSRALPRLSFDGVDKRVVPSDPLRSCGCGRASGAAEWRAP